MDEAKKIYVYVIFYNASGRIGRCEFKRHLPITDVLHLEEIEAEIEKRRGWPTVITTNYKLLRVEKS